MMQRLVFFTDLPSNLSCSILRDWLSLKSVMTLDSAFCCHSIRGDFLRLVEEKEYCIFDTISMEDKATIIYLLMRFGEKLRSIAFKRKLSAAQINFVAAYCSNVAYVNVYGLDCCTSGLWDFLHKLPNHAIVTLFTKRVHYSGLFATFLPFHAIESRQLYAFAEGSDEPNDHCISEEFIASGRNIIRLNFQRTEVTGSTLLEIITQCTRLTSLALNSAATNSVLEEIATICPHIAHLDLTNCFHMSDDGFGRMTQKLKRLQTLNIPFLSALSEKLSDLTITFTRWYCTEFLHTLHMSCTGNEFMASMVCAMLTSCTQLHTLSITGLFEDWVHVEDVFEPCTLNRLRTLILNGEIFQDLSFIGQHGANLEVLSIAKVHGYSSGSLLALLQSCSKLRKLYVDLANSDGDSSQVCAFANVAFVLLKTVKPRLEIISNDKASDLKYDVMRM